MRRFDALTWQIIRLRRIIRLDKFGTEETDEINESFVTKEANFVGARPCQDGSQEVGLVERKQRLRTNEEMKQFSIYFISDDAFLLDLEL